MTLKNWHFFKRIAPSRTFLSVDISINYYYAFRLACEVSFRSEPRTEILGLKTVIKEKQCFFVILLAVDTQGQFHSALGEHWHVVVKEHCFWGKWMA